MNRLLLIAIIVLGSVSAHAQAFPSKYPDLTIESLPAFFNDWKNYSDSIASMPAPDNVAMRFLADVTLNQSFYKKKYKYTDVFQSACIRPKYVVVNDFCRVLSYSDRFSAATVIMFPVCISLSIAPNAVTIFWRDSDVSGYEAFYPFKNGHYCTGSSDRIEWIE